MRLTWHSGRARAMIGAALVALGAAGCGALDTQNPNILDPNALNTPSGAATKRLGAISQFGLAKDGDFNPVFIPGTSISNDFSDGQILVSGILADEFVNPGFIPSRTEIDLRQGQPTNVTISDYFRSLHRARAATEDAAAALTKYAADTATNTGIPELLALAGFTYVYFAEDFCSGVPVSSVVNDTLVYGAQLTTAQVLDTAVVRFQKALAHSSVAAGDPIHSLAAIGLGRALLDQGQFAAAASAVQSVAPGFVYNTEHAQTPSALHNSVHEAWVNGNFGTYDREGGTGLDYVSAADIRIPGDSGIGADNNTPTWKPSKYPAFDSPIPTADYLEAQLITAEAALQAGGFATPTTGTLAILNTLRATAGLADTTDPGTATARTDLLFRERAFWLFATGHRLGDMRRLIRQYGRDPETVFPTGSYYKGGLTYGPGVNLPLPVTETNNPNVKDCLDRNP